MTHQELNFEVDMLCGNVNRMYLTNDNHELAQQKDWALRRINTLFDYSNAIITYEKWVIHRVNKALYIAKNQTIATREDAINRINEIFEQNKDKFE